MEKKIVEQVFTGSHYYRSLSGLTAIEDACIQLKMEAFWEQCDTSMYKDEIGTIHELRKSLMNWDSQGAQKTYKVIKDNNKLDKLLKEIHSFTENCKRGSEICLYFENFIKIIQTIKKLIRADREADFLLHIQSVGELCVIFTGGDGVNYQRCCSFYHELLKNLKKSHPGLFAEFMQGNFVVTTSDGTFNSVAADMKLEQSIQRSSKSSKGIIGQTRSIGYVTEWCLNYHEILAIKNTFQSIINPYNSSSETHVHHELSKSKILQTNTAIEKIKDFIKHRENPYKLSISSKQLKNISSQVVLHPDVAIKQLQFFELSSSKFNDFRKSVYVDQFALLQDTIHQFKLLPVDFAIEASTSDSKQNKNSVKELRHSTKVFNIVSERLGSPQKAIQYDITSYNSLFDGCCMTPCTGKSDMIVEIEAHLREEHYLEDVQATTLVLDFMSLCVVTLSINHSMQISEFLLRSSSTSSTPNLPAK